MTVKTFILALSTLLLVACAAPSKTTATMPDDLQVALTGYLQAGDANDATTLDRYMHDDFRVALYDAKADAVKVLDRATYRMMIDTKKFGGYPRTAEVQSVNRIGENMATLQTVLTSPGKPSLKNFYSLAKVGGEWKMIQDFVVLIP